MELKESKALIFIGLILGINIFTFATDKIQFAYLLFYISMALILMFISIKNSMKFGTEIIVYLIPIIYIFFSLLYTRDFNSGFKFTLFFTVFILINIILSKRNDWHKSFINTSLILSGVHVAITIFAFFFPAFYMKMFFPLFSDKSQMIMMKLLNAGAQVGLTNQTAMNGFLISIGLSILINIIITNKKARTMTYLLLTLYIIALVMTLKRSLILANIIACFFMIIISLLSNKKKLNNFLKVLIGISMMFIILLLVQPFFPSFNKIVERFAISDSSDFTSGRMNIYKAGFQLFKNRPILGNGIYSAPKLLASEFGLYGIQQMHNIYLQLLVELGLVGTIIFFILIGYAYLMTFKSLRWSYLQDNEKTKFMLGVSFYIQTIYIIYGFFGNPFTEHVFLLTYLIFVSISMYLVK